MASALVLNLNFVVSKREKMAVVVTNVIFGAVYMKDYTS